VTLDGPARTGVNLLLWKPGTLTVFGADRSFRAVQSLRPGAHQALRYRVPKRAGGLYAVEVKLPSGGAGSYSLAWRKR
jgi:hypothetical protein